MKLKHLWEAPLEQGSNPDSSSKPPLPNTEQYKEAQRLERRLHMYSKYATQLYGQSAQEASNHFGYDLLFDNFFSQAQKDYQRNGGKNYTKVVTHNESSPGKRAVRYVWKQASDYDQLIRMYSEIRKVENAWRTLLGVPLP